jgi:FkbM family methyltransferase
MPFNSLRRSIGYAKRLLKREPYDFSQSLEYSKLKFIFDRCQNRTIVDIGANDGKNCSNSFPLIKRGWKGLLVEANLLLEERILFNTRGLDVSLELSAITPSPCGQVELFLDRVTSSNLRASLATHNLIEWRERNLSNQSVFVNSLTINQLFEKYPQFYCPGVLSIDVEGLDSDILLSMTPCCVPVILIKEIDFSDLDRALAVHSFLNGLGLVMAFRIGCNEIFINANSPLFDDPDVRDFVVDNFS